MSREAVEVVRAVYDAAGRRDFPAVLALYHPDVEWDFSRSPVAGTLGRNVYRGHDGLRRWWGEWREAWESYQDGYDELIDAGDRVISVTVSRGRGRTSGAEIGWRQYGVWTVREGKVTRVVWLATREEALEAAAAPPQ
jgi:ketosteroid isomerase-like protein